MADKEDLRVQKTKTALFRAFYELLSEKSYESITVNELCERVYHAFEAKGIKYPTVKFRRMRTKWGICRPERGELTFSYMLAAAPVECIEYVVYHEFTHFIHPNHSKAFYESLERLLPDFKERKKRLGDFEKIK